LGADRFLDAHRMSRAALDPRVAGQDHASRARYDAHSRNRSAAKNVVETVILMHSEASETGELQKWRIAVENEVDALPRRQLPPLAEFPIGACGGFPHLLFISTKFRDQPQVVGAIGAKIIAADNHIRANRRHAAGPPLHQRAPPRLLTG